MKFYPSDWRGEPKLKMCSLAARGLWVEMLCIMHDAEPYGHLVINGAPVNDAQLAAVTGIQESKVMEAKSELESLGVYSRNRSGTIYSRRMVEDERKSKEGEKHIKKRWKRQNSEGEQANEKERKNPVPNRPPNREPNTYIPDTRYQKEKESEIWWQGEVIRLNRKDYTAWFALYGGTDDQFMAWLKNRDDWMAGQAPEVRKNWFISTKKYLEKLKTGEPA